MITIVRRILAIVAGIVVICVLMAVVVTTSRTDTPQHFSEVHSGMTPQDVISVLGLPARPGTTDGAADANGVTFRYTSGTVHFTHNAVDKLLPNTP